MKKIKTNFKQLDKIFSRGIESNKIIIFKDKSSNERPITKRIRSIKG